MNLGIYPANSDETVAKVAKFLNVDLESNLNIESESKRPFPGPMKVRDILKYFCDV